MAQGTMMKGRKGDRSLDTVASAMMACDWSPEDTIVLTSLPFGATSTVIAGVVETLCERKPLFVVALDEFKAKRVFHCALVKMLPSTDMEVSIGRLHGLRLQGRTINAHRFHRDISVQPTPSGPIHFSFKVVENRALTEEMVKEALSFCGTIEDAVIRQQSISKHNGTYCGYGFLSFSTLEENINCVKYVYQRLIDGAVFDCQFSDSFQRSPHYSNDLKQLKLRRAVEYHQCSVDGGNSSDSIPGVYVDDPRRKQYRNEAGDHASVSVETTLPPQSKSSISNPSEPSPPPTLQIPMDVFPSYSPLVLAPLPAVSQPAPYLQPIGQPINYIHLAPPIAVLHPFHISYAPVMVPNVHVPYPGYPPDSRLLSKRI